MTVGQYVITKNGSVMVRFCWKASSVWSAEISHLTDRLENQRLRTNHNPFLVLITRRQLQRRAVDQVTPTQTQKPSLWGIGSPVFSLCLYSSSLYFLCLSISLFSSAVSLQSRIMHAGVFSASYKEDFVADLCNPSKANRNRVCSGNSVWEDWTISLVLTQL